jgi:transcriptional regulator with XRE-family HTH domain
MIKFMPVRQSPLDLGTARGRALVAELARSAEEARLERGLSYAGLGRALRLAPGQVAQICRGQSPNVSITRMAQLLAVLGLELSSRAYPAGPPVRDAAQLALLGRLRVRLPANLKWRTEVPVSELSRAGAVDHRAWDAAVDGAGWTVRIEAETHIRDVQAVQRRIALKQRDGEIQVVVLLLSDSRHHRDLLAAAGAGLRDQFPISARRTLSALADSRSPAGNALVLL